MDWVYWSISPGHSASFHSMDDGTYEIVILVSSTSIRFSARAHTFRALQSPPELPLPRTNTTVDGQDAYATSDIAVPHPSKSGLWRIVGRVDEQIVLSNGEKTNPVPLGQSWNILSARIVD